ncbi:hypothetical protein ACUXV3_07680 [Roseobacteraceae bacterium NS-SX3]
MKARTRFLKSVIKAAKSETADLPWSRKRARTADRQTAAQARKRA